MVKRIAVVVSQGQSNNPVKRDMEEEIVAALMMEPGIDVTVIPHLYDLKSDGTGMVALSGIAGNMIILSWLYERAARWVLDRNGICGHVGESLIQHEDDDEEEAELDEDKDRVIQQREIPNRKIYCLDLQVENSPQPYIEEVKRIASENSAEVVNLMNWVGGDATPEQLERFQNPTNDTALAGDGTLATPDSPTEPATATRIEGEAGRRWYPVIDYSRCTNCMECIDFCLFGVYGIDTAETILVEQPDSCRKGCPACSRVCPENAIIFPQHKSPAIAGAPVDAGALKIDLSKLFGAPEDGRSAEELAVAERDEQLLAAGREAVGNRVGVPKRQTTAEPRDELDDLIDQLDELDI
ncbi:MAG TPA: ferredoxin family protein [Planctomycetaceae bacterium]|nr:ferredoxin [Blastopirellula sp.]HAY81980.1 ferredoxin family protein [Planctomycetaceae bacterium]